MPTWTAAYAGLSPRAASTQTVIPANAGIQRESTPTTMANRRLKEFRSHHEKLYWSVCAALGLGCVFLVMHAIYGSNGYLTLHRQRREYQATQQRIHELEQEKASLEQQVKGLKSDPKAIERVAREKMHLVRPGEIIYTLPQSDSSGGKAPATAAKATGP